MNNRRRIIVDELDAIGHVQNAQPGSDFWTRGARMVRRLFGQIQLPPVPEHDLFQAHNVTGRTGSGNDASVYYQSGNTFSHVTTQHSHANNIGRSHTRTFADYSIGNTGSRGQSQEFYDGQLQHTSRNPFVPVRSSAEQNRLHSVARGFPNLKSKYKKK